MSKLCKKYLILSELCQKSKKSPPEKKRKKVDAVQPELAFLRRQAKKCYSFSNGLLTCLIQSSKVLLPPLFIVVNLKCYFHMVGAIQLIVVATILEITFSV